MFEQIVPISEENYRDLRYQAVDGYGFASGQTAAPLGFTEIPQAAKYYPIVFPESGPPTAILGFEGRNLYLDDQGGWKAPVIPAHVLRYPFILGGVVGVPGAMAVMVDVQAPHFSDAEGELLLDQEGEPGALLLERQEMLNQLQREYLKTEQLTKVLHEAGVLKQRQLQHGPDKKTILSAFYVIDEECLQSLPDETILSWRGNGILALVYAHLLSMQNLNELVAEI